MATVALTSPEGGATYVGTVFGDFALVPCQFFITGEETGDAYSYVLLIDGDVYAPWSSPTWISGAKEKVAVLSHFTSYTWQVGVLYKLEDGSDAYAWSGTRTFLTTGEGDAPAIPPDDLMAFPMDRPDDYDADAVWVPGLWVGGIGGTYTPPAWGAYEDGELVVAGGGRWNKQMIALGHNVIYFEPLT